jgi:hypothetical protein
MKLLDSCWLKVLFLLLKFRLELLLKGLEVWNLLILALCFLVHVFCSCVLIGSVD